MKTVDAAQVLLWKLRTNELPRSKYYDELRDLSTNQTAPSISDLVNKD